MSCLDPVHFCPCGKSPSRKQFNGLCTVCWNEKNGDASISMEAKYNRKPTIDEIEIKHEMITKELNKELEVQKDINLLDRERFKQEKIIYEMKIEALQKNLSDLFAAHSTGVANYEQQLKDWKDKLDKKPQNNLTPEEEEEINKQIAEKEAQLKRLENEKIMTPRELSDAVLIKKNSSVYAPTASTAAKFTKKKVVSK